MEDFNKQSGSDPKRRALVGAMFLSPFSRLGGFFSKNMFEDKENNEEIKEILSVLIVSSIRECFFDRFYFQRHLPTENDLVNKVKYIDDLVKEVLLNITKNINNNISDSHLTLLRELIYVFLKDNDDLEKFLKTRENPLNFSDSSLENFLNLTDSFLNNKDDDFRLSFSGDIKKTLERVRLTEGFMVDIQILYDRFFNDSLKKRPYISVRIMQDLENIFDVGQYFGDDLLKNKILYLKEKGIFNSTEECRRIIYESFDGNDENIISVLEKLFLIKENNVSLDEAFLNKEVVSDIQNVEESKYKIENFFSEIFFRENINIDLESGKEDFIIKIIKDNFSIYLKRLEDKTENNINYQIQAFVLWFHELKSKAKFEKFDCTTVILFVLNCIFPEKRFNVKGLNSKQVVEYLSRQFSFKEDENNFSYSTPILNIPLNKKIVSFNKENNFKNNFMYICGVNNGGHMVTVSLNRSEQKNLVIMNDQHFLDRHLLQFPIDSLSEEESIPAISIKDIAKYYTLVNNK